MFKKSIIITPIVLFIGAALLFTGACKQGQETEDNPVPVISALHPTSKVIHMPSFILSVEGSDFKESSTIYFNGQAKETQYVNSNRLTCTITSDDIAGINPAPGTRDALHCETLIPVLVQNPQPGGGDSAVQNFTLHSNFTFTVSTAIPSGGWQVEAHDSAMDQQGNISILFKYLRNGSDVGVANIYSTDKGASWSSPQVLAESDYGYSGIGSPRIAADSSGNLHAAVFVSDDLNYYRSTDNGLTWSDPIRLAWSTLPMGADIAVDSNGNINIVYVKDDVEGHNPIYFKRSTDNGATFSSVTEVYPQAMETYDYFYSAAVATDHSQKILVTWMGPLEPGITRYKGLYCNSSHDVGSNWSESLIVGQSVRYTLAVGPDNVVHVFVLPYFGALVPAPANIIYYRSTDWGTTWSSPQDVTVPGSGETNLSANIDSAGNIALVYVIDGGCFFKRSIDNGMTWSVAVAVGSDYEPGRLLTDGAGNVWFTLKETNGIHILHLAKSQ